MREINETNEKMNEEKYLHENIHAAFDNIHAEETLKARTKEYLSLEILRKQRNRHFALFRIAAAAVCLVAALFLGGAWMFLTPTAYISIDINPSLELGINRFNRVVSVEGFNDDGRELAEFLDVRFRDYNDAVEMILNSQDISGYLAQNAVMTVTVAGETTAQHDEILENVETCVSEHENVSCHSGSVEEMQEAHDSGLSFGKYRALLELQKLDSSITADDIRDLSMREIYDMMKEYSDNPPSSDASPGSSDVESDANAGKGNGEHHRYGHH